MVPAVCHVDPVVQTGDRLWIFELPLAGSFSAKRSDRFKVGMENLNLVVKFVRHIKVPRGVEPDVGHGTGGLVIGSL
jgi:hypothetical protein